MSLRLSLAVVLVSVVAAPAWADDKPAGGDSKPTEGMEPASDPNVGDEDATADEPNDPDAMTTKDPDAPEVKQAARPTKATYPIEITQRPMTLTQNQAEVVLDAPVVFGIGKSGTGFATQVLHARFGVTQDLQLGVSYGFGLERLSTAAGAKSFEAGKAMSVDGAYTIIPDHLAATLSVPIYFSPFAASITLGAPFRLRLGKKVAIVGLNDLLQIALGSWPVTVEDPAYNIGEVVGHQTNVKYDTGNVHVNVGVQVQLKPNLVLSGTMGFHVRNFDNKELPVSLFGGLAWSKNKALDVGARIGWNDLAHGETFGLGLFAAYRL